MTDHSKGLLITALGVLFIVPDLLFVRLIDADTITVAFWRNLTSGAGGDRRAADPLPAGFVQGHPGGGLARHRLCGRCLRERHHVRRRRAADQRRQRGVHSGGDADLRSLVQPDRARRAHRPAHGADHAGGRGGPVGDRLWLGHGRGHQHLRRRHRARHCGGVRYRVDGGAHQREVPMAPAVPVAFLGAAVLLGPSPMSGRYRTGSGGWWRSMAVFSSS